MLSKEFFYNFLISIGYVVLLILFYFLTNSIIHDSFNFNRLYNWDAEHYVEIKNNFYANFRGENGDERAFFPLFPLIWRFSGLSQIGISVFNLIAYITSQSFIFTYLKLKKHEILALMSVPSLIFMYVPYTESLFYFGSAILFMGSIKKKNGIVFIAFLLLSLTRPAYSILLPAYLGAQFFLNQSLKKALKKVSVAVLACTLATFIVGFIQKKYSGEWFGFLYAQKASPWFNVLQIPTLPFRSWEQFPAMPLDYFSLFFGVLSSIYLFTLFLKKIQRNQIVQNEIFIVSIFYIIGISLAVLLFRGGSFHSLNRFIFSTIFSQIFIIYSWRLIKFDFGKLILIFSLLALIWTLFNGFTHLRLILSFLGLTLYLLSLTQLNHYKPRIKILSSIVVILFGFIVQIFFLDAFFYWHWVG